MHLQNCGLTNHNKANVDTCVSIQQVLFMSKLYTITLTTQWAAYFDILWYIYFHICLYFNNYNVDAKENTCWKVEIPPPPFKHNQLHHKHTNLDKRVRPSTVSFFNSSSLRTSWQWLHLNVLQRTTSTTCIKSRLQGR